MGGRTIKKCNVNNPASTAQQDRRAREGEREGQEGWVEEMKRKMATTPLPPAPVHSTEAVQGQKT